MFKKLLVLIFSIFVFGALAQHSFAATSIRLEQPQTPTSQNSFALNFVALDTDGSPVTVTCWKQGPGDAGFSQFGSSISLSNGGNSDNCPVDSNVINNPGSYSFYVIANSTTSNTVTVSYDNTKPGDPTNFSKSQNNSCQYVISFTTANDGGKTVKVELYRSDSTNFTVDSGTRVDSQNIGSNASGSFTNNVPDCSKTWYFAIRAISSDGNASNAVGDSTTTTNTVTIANPTTVQQQGGAIPVNSANSQVTQPTGGEGTVAGATTPAPTAGQKNVLGAQSHATPTPANEGFLNTVFSNKKAFGLVAVGILVLLGLGYYFFIRLRKGR